MKSVTSFTNIPCAVILRAIRLDCNPDFGAELLTPMRMLLTAATMEILQTYSIFELKLIAFFGEGSQIICSLCDEFPKITVLLRNCMFQPTRYCKENL